MPPAMMIISPQLSNNGKNQLEEYNYIFVLLSIELLYPHILTLNYNYAHNSTHIAITIVKK